MRGYGSSSIPENHSDYCMKEIVEDMIELLSSLGHNEAIWVGHDWGSPVVWNIALHHPEVVKGLVSLCVSFGWGGHPNSYLSTVNRDVYPIDEYPYGQWDYMFFYLDNFELVLDQMEEDLEKFLAITFRRPSDETISMFNTAKGYKSPTALITKNGGWFRQDGYVGLNSMPEIRFDEQIFSGDKAQFYIDTFKKNGLRGPNSWYMNGSKNDDYAKELGQPESLGVRLTALPRPTCLRRAFKRQTGSPYLLAVCQEDVAAPAPPPDLIDETTAASKVVAHVATGGDVRGAAARVLSEPPEFSAEVVAAGGAAALVALRRRATEARVGGDAASAARRAAELRGAGATFLGALAASFSTMDRRRDLLKTEFAGVLCEVLADAGAPSEAAPLMDALPDACVAACILCRGSASSKDAAEARRIMVEAGCVKALERALADVCGRDATDPTRFDPPRRRVFGEGPVEENELARFFGRRRPCGALLVDCYASLREDEAGVWAVPEASAVSLRRLARGWPYIVQGSYDEAEASQDLVGLRAAGGPCVVEAFYSARAVLGASRITMPPDLERAAALKDQGVACASQDLWEDAEIRFAWCRRLVHGPRLSADAAALAVAAHANRAEALLRLRDPRAALLECRAALLLDPAHEKCKARVLRADAMIASPDAPDSGSPTTPANAYREKYRSD